MSGPTRGGCRVTFHRQGSAAVSGAHTRLSGHVHSSKMANSAAAAAVAAAAAASASFLDLASAKAAAHRSRRSMSSADPAAMHVHVVVSGLGAHQQPLTSNQQPASALAPTATIEQRAHLKVTRQPACTSATAHGHPTLTRPLPESSANSETLGQPATAHRATASRCYALPPTTRRRPLVVRR